MVRRITLEGRLHDYHPEVGRLWRSRNDEIEQQIFNRVPKWMIAPYEDRDTRIDVERLFPPMLNTLTNKEKTVLWCMYYADFTLEEVGFCFRVTKERIRQIHVKALRKLKKLCLSNSLLSLVDCCPIEKRKKEEESEVIHQFLIKYQEDQLIKKMLELRVSTNKKDCINVDAM